MSRAKIVRWGWLVGHSKDLHGFAVLELEKTVGYLVIHKINAEGKDSGVMYMYTVA